MKAEKLLNISKYVLYALSAVAVVVLALFFGVGEPLELEQVSEATNERTVLPYPQYTDLLIYLCYAMCVVTLLLVLGFELFQAVKNFMYDKKGFMKSMMKLGIAAVVVVVVFFISPSKLDFVLYLQYVLLAVTALLMLCSLFISKMRS